MIYQEFYTIDSGKAGAIIEFRYGEPVQGYEIPYDGDFIDLDALTTLEPHPVFIEQITPYAPNAKTLAVQFQAYGALVSGCRYISEDNTHLIPVPTWQSFARKTMQKKPQSKWTKDDSRALSQEFWPEFTKQFIRGRRRKLPDGIADALCLGAYILGGYEIEGR